MRGPHKNFPEERRWLITQLKRFDYGKEQINRIIAPVSFVIAVFTLFKVYDISFTANQIFFVSAIAVGIIFAIGLVWDWFGMIEEEIEYANERNRFVKAMLKHSWRKKLERAKITRK
jgi:signal transduction histidine kinase